MTMAKKIKKIFFKIFLMSSVNARFKKEPAVFESIVSADPKKLFVIILAFNKPDLIELHYTAIKKFLRDEYEYFIMDNSSEDEPSAQIKDYCLAQGLNYIRLPKNPGIDESINPGLAFNWIYSNLIVRFKPDRFGFIDSDLFPIEPVSISPYLEEGDAWGVIHHCAPRPFRNFRKEIWYLWLGLLFFRREYLNGQEPNFLPGWGIDAGGRVHVNPDEVKKLPDVYDLHGKPGEPWTVEPVHGVRVHFYGKFVHFIGGSWQSNGLENQIHWMKNILKNN
jgi:glycosyltransferase involved in cell wall biosynthesis